MAGFIINTQTGEGAQFHIDTVQAAEAAEIGAFRNFITRNSWNRRVITMQLDGDELDAVIWGLKNYRKGQSNGLVHQG